MYKRQEDACLIEDNHEAFVNHIVNVMQNTTKIVDDLSKIEGPFLKIAICNMIDDTKVIMQYLEHLQEMFGAEIKVVTSGNIWIDFIAPGTNKGAALSNLSLIHIFCTNLDTAPVKTIDYNRPAHANKSRQFRNLAMSG